MSTVTHLMTVEEFLQLPAAIDGRRMELLGGEIIQSTAPKRTHLDLQHRLHMLLLSIVEQSYTLRLEFPFRATPLDFFRADIGIVANDVYEPVIDYLDRAPDIVIEVESASNTAVEFDLKEATCLANGCQEFWVVYPKSRYVRVTTGNIVHRYREGDRIPLTLFPGRSLAVSEIFAILPNS